jgi:hypothetical protein
LTVQGGTTANKNGTDLEAQVHTCITRAGYPELNAEQKRMLISSDGVLITEGSRWFASQVRLGKNIYEGTMTVDFYLYDKEKWPDGLYIEVKWQASSGSVDEKYVFTALSLIGLPGDKVLILDGSGYRPGAVKWLRKQAAKRSNRLKVFTLMEFYKWAKIAL